MLYDSTFDGLLSAAAWCFRRGIDPEGLLTEFDELPLFESQMIPCERHIRRLFRRHLRERLGQEAGDVVMDTIFQAFLSESEGIAFQIWLYLKLALQLRQDPAARLYERPVAAVVGAARRVAGQAHQYLGLLRFRLAGPALYLADFAPDYHVLPLILPHFADRLADQDFVIRDQRRHLAALHLSSGQISLHLLTDDDSADRPASPNPVRLLPEPDMPSVIPAADPDDFPKLWQRYLERLSIPERSNPALQKANMPRKYWKYLTENPDQ